MRNYTHKRVAQADFACVSVIIKDLIVIVKLK